MAIEIGLKGKVALVTGGGRGIGCATAICLAQAGADICVTARTEKQIQATAEIARSKGCKALAIPADVTDAKAVTAVVERTIEKLGGLHLLVNNAGTELAMPLMDTSEEQYNRVMDTNMKSMFLFTKAVGAHFIKQKFGRVVNMASVGSFLAAPNQSIYQASKAAVAHFTRSMAIEWARHNILVNAVAPGWVQTEMIKPLSDDPEKLSRYLKAIPLRRLGKPEEIAPLVAFLCSDLSSFMTGTVVIIDGGLMIP